jgi:hypothetical protein
VDESRNRETANIALKDAIRFGDKNDMKKAREVLSEAIGKIEKSKTASVPKCKGLLGDLKTAKNELRDKRQYRSQGRKYVRQNVSCYAQQRSCQSNRDNRYQYQSNFMNRTKTVMTTSWEARDNLDSDSDDEDHQRNMRKRRPKIKRSNTTRMAPPPPRSSQHRRRRSDNQQRSSRRRRSANQQQQQQIAQPIGRPVFLAQQPAPVLFAANQQQQQQAIHPIVQPVPVQFERQRNITNTLQIPQVNQQIGQNNTTQI